MTKCSACALHAEKPKLQTHTECVIRITFQWQQSLRERASLLSYTYITSCWSPHSTRVSIIYTENSQNWFFFCILVLIVLESWGMISELGWGADLYFVLTFIVKLINIFVLQFQPKSPSSFYIICEYIVLLCLYCVCEQVIVGEGLILLIQKCFRELSFFAGHTFHTHGNLWIQICLIDNSEFESCWL
jgi:hypothetical protein